MSIKNILSNIIRKGSRQHYTGLYIGAVMDTYSRTAIIISAIQFISVLIILYDTSVEKYLPGVNIFAYMLVVIIGIAFMMVLVIKIATPSSYGWHNVQVWNHPNPMKDAILANGEKIDALQRELTEIKKLIEDKDA